jgi:hypothetical protein
MLIHNRTAQRSDSDFGGGGQMSTVIVFENTDAGRGQAGSLLRSRAVIVKVPVDE